MWTDNSIQAIIRQLSSHVRWPTVTERYASNTTSSLVMRYPAASVSLIAPISTSNMLPLGLQRRLDPSTVAKERYGFNIVAVVDDMKRICYLHWGLSASAGDKSMRLHAHPDDNFDDGNTS